MKKINSLQISTLLTMLIISSFLGIGIYSIIRYSQIDALISITISCALGISIFVSFIIISNYRKDLPINKKITTLLGTPLGKVINLIIITVLILKCIVLMYNLTNFIESQFLSETPPWIIGILFTLTIIYINIKGIEVITRVTLLLFFLNIALFIIAFLGLAPKIDLTNFLPILEFGMKRPIIGSIYIITFNITPIFSLLIIPRNNITDNQKYTKYTAIFYIIASLIMICAIFATIGCLGIELTTFYQYPEYIVLKNIKLFNFLDRIENIIMIQWLFGLFTSLSFYTYYITNTIKYNHTSKMLPTIIAFIIFITSLNVFKNNTTFNTFIYSTYIYIEFAIIIIFFIISIICLFKGKSSSKTTLQNK